MLLERNDFDLSMIAYLIVPFCITLGNCSLIGIRVSVNGYSVLFCYYRLILVILLLLFLNCFGVLFLEAIVYGNNLLTFEVGVRSMYTLPPQTPHCGSTLGMLSLE